MPVELALDRHELDAPAAIYLERNERRHHKVLIGNPPVIFLDEPTTGLDPEGRIEVWQAVKELTGQGTTVLLTTQQLEEAEHLADRIAILHEGRIVVNGTLAELRQVLPPAKVEYVEKQPTLEDIFFALVGDGGNRGGDAAGSNDTK